MYDGYAIIPNGRPHVGAPTSSYQLASAVLRTMPHGPVMYIAIYSRRAAQGSLYRGADRQRRSERLKTGPYDAAIRPQKRATSHEPLTTNNKKALAVVPPLLPNPGYLCLTAYFPPSGHEIRHKRLTRFCASQSSFIHHSLRVHHYYRRAALTGRPLQSPGDPGRIGSRAFPTSH